MKTLLKFFPLNDRAKDIFYLVAVILVYAALGWAAGFIGMLTGWVPLLGWLINLIVWVIRLYCGLGIILVILQYAKIIR
jgi:hypothetical protein